MRRAHTVILAGAAALFIGSAAVAAAAELHHMNVDLPDGSVAQIEYTGNVAPKVTIAPAAGRQVALVDPFAQMDQIMASMEARHRAMMAQMAAMQRAAAAIPAPPLAPGEQLVAAGNAPQGAGYSMVSVSSTTDANGCTHTVETRANGNGAPQVTKTSSGACGDAKPGAASEAQRKPAPGKAARPAAEPAQPAIPLSDRV
ncbi:MAG TPA: hypothetical protein VF418_03220 [Sphingomonadaceae bacterium]